MALDTLPNSGWSRKAGVRCIHDEHLTICQQVNALRKKVSAKVNAFVEDLSILILILIIIFIFTFMLLGSMPDCPFEFANQNKYKQTFLRCRTMLINTARRIL